MSIDLDEQLVLYFEWLERQVGAPMRRADVSFEPNRAPGRPWRVYAGAASLVAGLVVAGVIASSALVDKGQRITGGSTENSLAVATTSIVEADSSTIPSPTGSTNADMANTLAPGSTEILPASPLAGRVDSMAVWTGLQMIVWGGSAPRAIGGETPFDDGALYDPVARAWTMLPVAPISARSNAATVWTGAEMLIWGGSDDGTSLFDGAAYNPTTSTWRQLPTFDLAATIRPTTVWTGTEMIVLEGINGAPSGGTYKPAKNLLGTIASPPGRNTEPKPQAVWTGHKIVMTLTAGDNDRPIIAVYDPTNDSWDELATDMGSGQRPRLLWTGFEVLAFGMTNVDGGAWNPATGTWRTLAAAPRGPGLSAQPVWTGALAVFWNGAPSVITYDPSGDIWTETPGGELPQPRLGGTSLWANGILLSWGGFISNPDGTASGASDGIAWRPSDAAGSAPSTFVPSLPVVPTSTSDTGITSAEPRHLEVAVAQDLLPPIDLPSLASAGISVQAEGLDVRSARGLPASQSPVGNDVCLVVSELQVATGQVCASSADTGGLTVFTQEWSGGVALAVLTAANVLVGIDGCADHVSSASNAFATLTLCASFQPEISAAGVRLQLGAGEGLIVAMPVNHERS